MRGVAAGDHVAEHDGTVSGMIAGSLTVRAGVRVEVSAMVAGDVVLEPGSEARITGMVGGRMVNRGGRAVVTGMVARR